MNLSHRADVAELADALGSGLSSRKGVEVQVLSSAPNLSSLSIGMSVSQTGLLTVDEFLKLPEPKEGRLELHHGEVVQIPPPKKGHQRIQNRLQEFAYRSSLLVVIHNFDAVLFGFQTAS
jgi:hypothetical protein